MPTLLFITLLLLGYFILIKRNLLHPIIYFFGIWTVTILLTTIDYYHIRIEISEETILVIGLGLVSFLLGTIPNISLETSIRKKLSQLNKSIHYYTWIIYTILTISILFNFFMTTITIGFLHQGYDYSSIRDILYSYDDKSVTFFNSTFFSTFNSWISQPCTYVISSVVIIETFEKNYGKLFRIFALIDVALYTFALGERLLLLLMLAQLFFAMNFYKKKIPKKYVKKIISVGILIIIILLIMTQIRAKEDPYYSEHVNSIYAYFSVSIPLLSHWLEVAKDSQVYSMGNGFFYGVTQIINYNLAKIGLTFPFFDETTDLIGVTQESWIQIYDGHWYNAFCSLFYYFYIDFREFGVFCGSLVYGFICKYYYRKACVEKNKNYLIMYMILIQTMIASFVRWQFGTVTYLVAFVLSGLCVNWKYKEYANPINGTHCVQPTTTLNNTDRLPY